MKHALVALCALFPAALATDAGAAAPAAASAIAATAVAQVNGLVCDFCARSLEKVLGRRAEVSAVTVDMDAQEVRLTFKPGRTITDAELRRLIADAGFATVAIRRGAQ